MAKLKNVVVLDKKMLNKIAEGEVKVDGRLYEKSLACS